MFSVTQIHVYRYLHAMFMRRNFSVFLGHSAEISYLLLTKIIMHFKLCLYKLKNMILRQKTHPSSKDMSHTCVYTYMAYRLWPLHLVLDMLLLLCMHSYIVIQYTIKIVKFQDPWHKALVQLSTTSTVQCVLALSLPLSIVSMPVEDSLVSRFIAGVLYYIHTYCGTLYGSAYACKWNFHNQCVCSPR